MAVVVSNIMVVVVGVVTVEKHGHIVLKETRVLGFTA